MRQSKLLKYDRIERSDLQRAPEERACDHRETEIPLAADILYKEASRCGQCGVPSCHTGLSPVYTGCPLENNIPDIHRLVTEGDMRAAYNLSASTNPMGAITGRVCPSAKSLCESACVLNETTGSGHGYVSIRRIEAAVHDMAWKSGWAQPIKPVQERRESIGIIGSGPGGYAAAAGLRALGYGVTIYERSAVPGGLLTLGIPGFKLEKEIVDPYYKNLEASGVVILCESAIGDIIPFEQILALHDAAIVATGKYKPKDSGLEGTAEGRAVNALDFLTRQNFLSRGIPAENRYSSDTLDAKGKTVIVNGGGDTAMDCARTAIRQGAAQVFCLYRRDEEDMPGSQKEVKAAKAEGVRFLFMHQAKAVNHKNGGGLVIQGARTVMAAPDKAGRRAMSESGETFAIEADMMINALGFDPENLPVLFGADGLPVTRRGTLALEEAIYAPRSNIAVAGLVKIFENVGRKKPVFAVGDIAGSNLVVEALLGGREVAKKIHEMIKPK